MLQIKENLSQEVKNWIIYPYEEAVRENAVHPLYPKMNFHWVKGRYTKLMASAIASGLGVADYEEPGLEEFERCTVKTDLEQFIGFALYDKNHLCTKKGVFEAMGITGGNLEKLGVRAPYSQHFGYSVNRNKPLAPKILLIGDSFTPAMSSDLTRYFSEAIGVHILRVVISARETLSVNEEEAWKEAVKMIRELTADYKPDYIVFFRHSVVDFSPLVRLFMLYWTDL